MKLNCVIPYTNPCEWRRQRVLMNEFIDRLVLFDNIHLYVIEVEYDGCPFDTVEVEKRVKKSRGWSPILKG